MLQFFKKPGFKEISNTPFISQDDRVGSFWIKEISNLDKKEEEEICKMDLNEICTLRSQLSKTLPEILADKNALGYFIQYIESRDQIALIKFWLEVECLCASGDQEKNTDINGFTCNEMDDLNDLPKNATDVEPLFSNIRQDALRIYKKFIASNALGPNRIPDELKLEIKNALTSQNTEILLKSLIAVQQIVYRVLEQEYVNSFLRSSFNCKHQIDVLTSGNVQLADILYDETAFFYFIEFMEQENKRGLLDFWISAVTYKQNLLKKDSTVDPLEAQSDALAIYEKFFSLQATTPLGMSDRIRFDIEQNICREDGKGPQPDCFDKPCKIVYHYFVKYYLPSFLSSQLYYKYLSELIRNIQNSMCSNMKPNLKRADSDCSSEVSSLSAPVSIANKNEMEKRKPSSTSNSGTLNIDSKQLYDPDALWKRNKKSLSVGYIDNMGRFVTEIEREPRNKRDGESRLSRVVKKLVHLEQDETKEELAWKIAEMIVGDITSQTLGSPRVSS